MDFFRSRGKNTQIRRKPTADNQSFKRFGELLIANNQEISGWAIGASSEEPLLVTLVINGVEAVQVRANLSNKRFRSTDGHDRPCGFKFAIHESLRSKLPATNKIAVRLPDGTLLSTGKDYASELTGADGVSPQALSDELASGRILIPKSGALLRPISARDGWTDKALKSYQEAEKILREQMGKRLFVAYGTLLGLIRENTLLGHDDDVDAMFLLDSTDAKSAGEEFSNIAQTLSSAGQNITSVFPGGNLHWKTSNGVVLDVFGCWADTETLNGYMFSFSGSKSDIFPTVTRNLHGLKITTPAAPERFLEGIYGVEWRIPDPQFQWRPKQETLNRMTEFGKGVRGE